MRARVDAALTALTGIACADVAVRA